MYKKIIPLLIFTLFTTFSFAQGGLLNKIKSKAEQKAKDKVEKKVEEKVEEKTEKEEPKSSNNKNDKKEDFTTQKIDGGKMYFSNKPFKNGKDLSNVKTSFKAGEEIYGMVVMDKTINEYLPDDNEQGYTFYPFFYSKLESITGNAYPLSANLEVAYEATAGKVNYITFDVSPSPTNAVNLSTDLFQRIGAMFAKVTGYDLLGDKPKLGNKRIYTTQLIINYVKLAETGIEIDYTTSTKEDMKKWTEREQAAFDEVRNKTTKAREKAEAPKTKTKAKKNSKNKGTINFSPFIVLSDIQISFRI